MGSGALGLIYSTQLNSIQLNSIQLNSTQLNSTYLDLTRLILACLGLSWPVLAPFSDPTWPPKPVQNRSQTRSFCGSLFSSTFKKIFCRFLIDLRFARSSKTPPLPMILRIFLICACSLLDRFLIDLGVENRSKIDWKIDQKSDPQNDRFWERL